MNWVPAPVARVVLYSSNLLDRKNPLSASSFSSTALQSQVDSLIGGFVQGATDWKFLSAMTAGGLAYRAGRIGVMGLGGGNAVRAASIGLGLSAEVSAFEVTNRGLSTLFRRGGPLDSANSSEFAAHPGISRDLPWPPAIGSNKGHPHGGAPTNDLESNLWRWSGPGGLRQGLLQSFLTFGALKGAGHLARGENLIAQHLFQDTAMVLGHQASGALGIEPRPNGTLAEQFLHAEATNLQIGAGMALAHRFAPGINALERGLDLTLRIRNVGAAGSPRPQLGSRTGEETSPLQMRNGLQPLFATMTSRGPDRSSPFILAMSSLRDDGGEASPAPPRIFNALPKRGKNGADAFHLNPIPRQRWEKPNQVNVNELGVSEGGTLLTRGLTSCSALLLYDADRGAGAMIHLQPPVISRELKTSEEVHRFVDLAI